jgi:hypothetical protein
MPETTNFMDSNTKALIGNPNDCDQKILKGHWKEFKGRGFE